MKKALITGIYGQDGFYLTKLLLSKGYKIFGFVQKICNEEILYSHPDVTVYECSVNDYDLVRTLVAKIEPDECYHFAAVSFVSLDFQDELKTWETNFCSTQILLSTLVEFCPKCRFYLAGSSEMFGNQEGFPQTENSCFNPRSAYGIAKVASYFLVKKYRDYHGLFACTGIAYNHESPRRSPIFVTRKITSTVAKIYLGLENKLCLNSIDNARDWGYAPEYVEAIWRMLNLNKEPIDYVIATGVQHTVKYFVEKAFGLCGLDYQDFVEIKEQKLRPTEKVPLVGNSSKINKELGWYARKPLDEIIKEMVDFDITLIKKH